MKLRDLRSALRLAAVAAMLALALGIAACGGSDDDDGNATADSGTSSNLPSNQQASVDAPEDASDEEKEVYALYDEFVEAVFSGDAKGACATLSDRVRKQFETFGDKDRTCEYQIGYFYDKEKDPVVPVVKKLTLDGEHATAIVKAGKSALYPIPFSKESGEWQIDGGLTPE